MRDVSAASNNEAVQLINVDSGYELVGVSGLHASVQSTSEGCVVNLTMAGQNTVEVHIRHAAQQRWFSWALGRSMVWDVEHELEHSLHTGRQEVQEAQLAATLPGRISEVMLQVGQRVVAGDPVLTLEAMKLYHTLTAPLTGLVQSIHVTVGDIVSHGQLLVEFEPEVVETASA